MSLYRRKQSIKAQIVETQRLLDMVGDHPLMSFGLAERIETLRQELDSLPTESFEPKVQLLFSGEAVSGSQGIKASFVSKTIPPFQELVKSKTSKIRGGRARRGEKILRSKSTDLFVTALPRGSFGVELSQMETNGLFDSVDVSRGIKDVMNLISDSTSDESFESILEKTTQNDLVNLKKFLRGIVEEKSILKMESGELFIELSKDKIADAYERVALIIKDESEDFLKGIFKGILLDSKKFEFVLQDGKKIFGSIDDELSEWQLIEYNKLSNTFCEFHLRTFKIILKSGVEKTKYRLLGIKPLNE
ncbi:MULTISPECIES: hypothetical protein [unclassified Spirosoma]|uniref:hypothetical protein n=1 Tax=unclassified Spirosoma TaxID=2621999 RepID=UPI000966B01B|nr:MULTISPECIES: hypothetical protein [unclassified Spirosoma]MBN8825396.1 hypothetical protein [Spirosoma sp.]OJW74910.1 MAG: hypothetical protein BGO59_05275 [Spirosoma sp. 48-14]